MGSSASSPSGGFQKIIDMGLIGPSPSVQEEGVASGQEQIVTLVQSTDVLTSLRKTCETLNEYEKVKKETKEEYQMYNSGEMVGFNLKMK
jgi:hypothetical protein